MLNLFYSLTEMRLVKNGIHVRTLPAKWKYFSQREMYHHPCQLMVEPAQRNNWASALSGIPKASRMVNIILPDSLAKYFIVIPPENAVSLSDCQVAAEKRFQTLFGQATQDWDIKISWQFGKASFACALPKQLLAYIDDASTSCNQTILSIQTNFVSEWNRWKSQVSADAWFVVIQDQLATILMLNHQNLHAIRSIQLPDISDVIWLQQQLSREALIHNVPMPERLLVTGEVPDSWHFDREEKLNGMVLKTKIMSEKSVVKVSDSSADVTKLKELK